MKIITIIFNGRHKKMNVMNCIREEIAPGRALQEEAKLWEGGE